MPQHCIIPVCFGETNYSVFKVPKNIDRREKWLKTVRDVYPNLDVGENFCVCEKHFRKTDFTSYIADESGKIVQEVAVKRKRLKHGAVPHFNMLDLDSGNDSTKTILMEQDISRASTSSVLKPHGIIDAESDSEDSRNHICDECDEPVLGGRYVCAQCSDCELCTRCATVRDTHYQHYLFWVPPHRPPDKVKMILQKLHSMLENDNDGSEHEETVEIKMEIKDEVQPYDDPLTFDVKQEQAELEQEETVENFNTLKRDPPLFTYTKRRKQETCDVSSVPIVPELQPELIGEATAASNTLLNQHIIVKQEDDVSLRTFTTIPSMSPHAPISDASRRQYKKPGLDADSY